MSNSTFISYRFKLAVELQGYWKRLKNQTENLIFLRSYVTTSIKLTKMLNSFTVHMLVRLGISIQRQKKDVLARMKHWSYSWNLRRWARKRTLWVHESSSAGGLNILSLSLCVGTLESALNVWHGYIHLKDFKQTHTEKEKESTSAHLCSCLIGRRASLWICPWERGREGWERYRRQREGGRSCWRRRGRRNNGKRKQCSRAPALSSTPERHQMFGVSTILHHPCLYRLTGFLPPTNIIQLQLIFKLDI